ncbi:MAG TPA: NAD(+)/NADH kinase [Vicinamibacterales bacterium]|nr:NAD(+)/NADH kinase [Vicinamibacterales bacterium]
MADAITRVGLTAKHGLTAASEVLAELAGWLEGRGIRAVFETDTARLAGVPMDRATVSREDIAHHCDLVVVLGGDGTLIGMADRIASSGADVPILGVNYGSLGFLTEVTLAELYGALEEALAGRAEIATRAMLTSRTIRENAVFADQIVLNDIVITKAALSRMIEIAVMVDDAPVTTVRADGLIIASPTGSTAYNLAAGGPIVHPSVDAILLTPIAPHTLTNRPIVIPAASDVQVRPVMRDQDEVFVTFDGQSGFPLRPTDIVRIRRAPRPIRIVKSAKRTYFELLREKLKWGGDHRPAPGSGL